MAMASMTVAHGPLAVSNPLPSPFSAYLDSPSASLLDPPLDPPSVSVWIRLVSFALTPISFVVVANITRRGARLSSYKRQTVTTWNKHFV